MDEIGLPKPGPRGDLPVFDDGEDPQNRRDHRMDSKKTRDQREVDRRRREDDAQYDEAAPPPIPPRRGASATPIGAGVTSRVPGAPGEPIRLTVGKQQLSFSPDEFVEMIQDGSLARMVQSGQVRKLPGVG